MKKIKLSDSEIRLLLLFLAVLMFVAAYFLSFQRNIERAEKIEAQNEEDRATVQLLESMVARRPAIEAQTEEYRQTIADIVAKYPPAVPTEKAIEIIQEIEDRTGMRVSNISFSMNNQVVNLAASTQTMGEEGQVVPTGVYSVGYRDTIGMSYEAKYSDFKEMIAYIHGLSDRMTISSVSASYDKENGMISGVITVNMYYLTNTGREYDEPNITNPNKGVPNIFLERGER